MPASVLDPEELLRHLDRAGVRHVVIGGVAVGVHGVIRATKDLDICPDPEPENLERLAQLLTDVGATQADAGDFASDELPYDPTRPQDLAQGGNFRLATALGALDIMQWVSGIEADHAYELLERDAITVDWHGVALRICSLEHLRAMKEAAGRPQDLRDLADLEIANG